MCFFSNGAWLPRGEGPKGTLDWPKNCFKGKGFTVGAAGKIGP